VSEPAASAVLVQKKLNRVLLTNTNGTPALAEDPVTVVPLSEVVVDGLEIVMVAPTTKFEPKIVIARLEVVSYVTGVGLVEAGCGCGAVTTNPSGRVAGKPPDAAGLVTVTVCEPMASSVLSQ
jgi:hypothetical protein